MIAKQELYELLAGLSWPDYEPDVKEYRFQFDTGQCSEYNDVEGQGGVINIPKPFLHVMSY